MSDVKILDQHGQPIERKRSRADMIAGGGYYTSGSTYDSADVYSQRMEDWRPFLLSPDMEMNPFRDRMVSRSRDITRNDGWSSGVISRTQDNVVGSSFRPISKPDYRVLEHYTGKKTFDAVWAAEYGRAVDAHYRAWAEDPGHWCDASRQQTVSQMLGLGFRHKLIDGDALATMPYLTKNIGSGRARYATTVQLIDPDRLSNPQNMYDTQTMRGGVVVNHEGAAESYYIRRAHQGDWFDAADAVTWDQVPRETTWGRPMVIHDFEKKRAGQHRGGIGILNAVLQKVKMLYTYDNAELDQAIINTIFGAYVKSPFDPQMVQSALGESQIPMYQQMRGEFHNRKNLKIGDSRLPHLFPGEDIVTVKAEHPSANYDAFQATFLRSIASATGLSYEQVSSDWSKSNYSSARGALIEAWKGLRRQRDDYATGFAQPIFSCFVEESFEIDGLPLPAGAPRFDECRMAYSAAKWIGPAKGYIDPVKEKEGALIGISGGLSTLEYEAAENGSDWESIVDQRKIETAKYEELGLDMPAPYLKKETAQEVEKIG